MSTKESSKDDFLETAVDDIKFYTRHLKLCEWRMRIYKKVIQKLSQNECKLLEYLKESHKNAIHSCKEILERWDGLTLPTKPRLTDVVKAVQYSLIKEESGTRKKKLAGRKNIQKKAFHGKIKVAVVQWTLTVDEKCRLVEELEKHFERIHTIVMIFDKRFNLNLSQLFTQEFVQGQIKNSKSTEADDSSSEESWDEETIQEEPEIAKKTSTITVPVKVVLDDDDEKNDDTISNTKFMDIQMEGIIFKCEIVSIDRGNQTLAVDIDDDSEFYNVDSSVELVEISEDESDCDDGENVGVKEKRNIPAAHMAKGEFIPIRKKFSCNLKPFCN